ncbi:MULTISPECIES: DUF6602 domain-containing protein [Pseudomonas]|uniref:DUF6602 domain-containing protein n=1 Tax=Pseudomonas TaxID=286 RepID=UPI000B34C282|nr:MULTISPECIES: DUF6602 domain-containing protein [Pseudomonas]PMY60272.1 hypothetical protein C1Y31_28215 [Pseudomonas sp. FW305-25]PMY60610.1 hypothetical protein C1Y32_31095 [Pseudomonas sp. FW126-L8]PNA73520.1 hypothetical protein C1Y33_27015 [Pseudomonas sp. FW305-76]
MSKQQPDNALSTLLDEKIRSFVASFIQSSRRLFVDENGKLVHSQEFGVYRERIVSDFLKLFSPERMGVDSGFVVTSGGRISSQCDIVIYDKTVTPLIRDDHRQRFFPIESVCAVGEIKSRMSLSELKLALRKLAKLKSLRDSLYKPSYVYTLKSGGVRDSIFEPERDELDQIFTFLICESFSFNLQKHLCEIVDCYTEQHPKHPFCHRHNVILSLNDGLIAYLHPSGSIFQFPSQLLTLTDQNGSSKRKVSLMKHRLILPQEAQSIEHLRHFCTLFHQGLTTVSVLYPDMGRYIQSKEDVMFVDLEQKH